MTPRVFWRGATSSATPASSRRSSSTMGRAGEVRRTSSSGSHTAQLAHLFQVPGHQREGLVLAHLASTKRPNRPPVERVAGEVVASEALDGDDCPSPQHPGRPQDGVVRFRVQLVAEAVEQPYPRAADRAGVRLGVEAAVRGVVVLPPALGAHREAGHRGGGAVVGDLPRYGEAWAAVGAVGERVTVAAVLGIKDLSEAILAGGDVRGDEGPAPHALPALLDPEVPPAQRRELTPGHRLHHGHWRGVFFDPAHEEVQAFDVALDLDVYAFGVVADQPGEAVPARQGVDEGPEAHALHDAPDGDLAPLLYRRSHRRKLALHAPTCS